MTFTKTTASTITPNVRNAILMLLPAAILLPLLSKLLDVDYDVIADTTSNIVRGIIVMVSISLVWGLYVSKRAGWSKSIWSRQATATMPKIFWLLPVFWFAICLLRLLQSPWNTFDITYVLVLAGAMIMVGLNEELLFRGILAHGARGVATWSEARVMLISAAGFGMFHLPNVLAGQAVDATLFQVGYAFVMGCALYASMRISGTILLPVVMHAVWDFSTFTAKTGVATVGLQLGIALFLFLTVLLTLSVVIWAFWQLRRRRVAFGN